jgi:hypothetical protein
MNFSDYNRIKTIEDGAFNGLNNLGKVFLLNNDCVNGTFTLENNQDLQTLPGQLAPNCKSF